MAFKTEGKEMYSIFDFINVTHTMCCWSVHPKVVKAWQACAQLTQKNHSHTNSAVSLSSICICPACLASVECIFLIYNLVSSKIRSSDAEEDNH